MKQTRRYSNSYIQSYKTCPLQCYLKNEVSLKKIDEEATEHHLVYGRAMHVALKEIYLGGTVEKAKELFKEGYPTQLDLEDKAKTQPNGLIALDEYVKRWKEEDTKWKVISVEEKETFDYVEDGFTVVLDLVMENRAYGGIYGFDHKIVGKSKATLSADFWNQFDPNSQVTKYVSFIKSKYGDCSGFYINAIGMRWLEKKYKDSPAGFNIRFGRQMFNRNQAQLDIEHKDTEYWIQRIEQSKQDKLWGMNTESCRWCEYRSICAAGWTYEADKELIEINYQVAPRSEKGDSNAVRTRVSSE